jgi:IPT/TIG domain
MKIGVRASALAVFSIIALSAPSAHAAVVTLGQANIPPTFTAGYQCHSATECRNGHTFAELSSPDIAAASGVITSWRVTGAGELALRVLAPAAAGGWLGAGTSSTATDVEGGPNATDLPIEAGDLIGVDTVPGGTEVKLGFSEAPGVELLNWAPPLAEGTGGPANFSSTGHGLLLNAEVELTPVVASVLPASGSTAGGNTVTITGAHLDGATNVVFGSHPATNFSVDLAGDRITATAPPSSASTVDVYVSNLHSSSKLLAADRYTFVAPVGPGTTSGPGGPAANAKPTVSGFAESAGRWRLGRSLPHISSSPVGTTFAFNLNAPANLALTFTQSVTGRRMNGRCVAPSHKSQTRPRCKRTIVRGSLPLSGHAGVDKVRFQGRLSAAKMLTPGNYSVSITTRDSHGPKGLTRSLAFTILP